MLVRIVGLLGLLTIVTVRSGDVKPEAVPDKPLGTKGGEDSIPVIEIRGEGAPMTAAQIRALEEATDGPQDIKVDSTIEGALLTSNCSDFRSRTRGSRMSVQDTRRGRTSLPSSTRPFSKAARNSINREFCGHLLVQFQYQLKQW